MEYPGLSEDDLNNVRALNRSFLDCLRQRSVPNELRDEGAMPLAELVSALSEKQVERLASSPFLLFSMRERQSDYWSGLFEPESTGDLFADRSLSDDDAGRLVAASLAYLWQLSARNPYAVRVIAGADLGWCEQLSDCTLVDLLGRVAGRRDVLLPRFLDNKSVWTKLLSAGVSAEIQIRRAAHLAALQTMLTRTVATAANRLPAAACRMPRPTTR